MSGCSVGLYLIGWFLVGLFSGFFCSFVDTRYKGFRFNWFDPFKMSFLGLLLFIWTPFFFMRSKKEYRLRSYRKPIFPASK